VIPMVVGEDLTAFRMTVRLQQEGVFVNPVVSPAVPPGRSMIRTSYNVSATEAGWFATIRARTPAPPDHPDPEIGFRCAADAGAGRQAP